MRASWILALLLLPASAGADDFTSWLVPWEKTRPRDPAVDAEGRVWFAGQGGDYVAWLDPQSGKFTRFELPEGAGPHNLIVGREQGDVWIAGNAAGWIGRMDPDDGQLQRISTREHDVDDPHTLVQSGDGRIWFTAQSSNRVGVLDPDSGDIRTWRAETARSRPYGIVLDDNDQPWIVLLGTNRLATVVDGELREIELPREDARPRRLDVINGAIWYVDYAEGRVGRYDPARNEFREWRSPSGDSAAPYGAIGADDVFYYVETGPQPNRMIGIDTRTGKFVYNEPVPESGGAVRHMFHDEERNAVWFGMDTNYIGRFTPPR